MDNGQCREVTADYQLSIDHSPLDEVPPGYKRTKVGVIPEDWDARTLRDDIKLLSGHHVLAQYCNTDGVGAPYLTGPADFPDGQINVTRFTTAPTTICERGDILVTVKGSGAGTLIVSDGRYCISRQLMAIRADQWNKTFLFYSLMQNATEFQAAATGLIPGLSRADILLQVIPVPRSADEQRAIATALSDVDALITALDKLIAKKRAIKTAAMQQLLTGKARLPGFSGEWETKRLGEVCDIRKGELITASTAKPGIIPVIGGGTSVSYCHDTPNRAANTITISASGANAGYVAFHDYPIFASDCSTIEEGEVYDIKFIYYLLSNYQKTLTSLQTGGAQPHVYPEQLAPLSFAFPEQPEQTAIAQVLSDMDAEIATLEARRDKTRAIKQGMMQQVLTGRVRLVKPEMEAC